MSQHFIIAVDGPAASGKGTLAQRLADLYGLPLLDTGLLYRAVGIATPDLFDAAAAEAAARAAAAQLRGSGSFLFTIGLGADVDGGLLVDIAGAASRYSYAPDQTALGGIYQILAWSLPCR